MAWFTLFPQFVEASTFFAIGLYLCLDPLALVTLLLLSFALHLDVFCSLGLLSIGGRSIGWQGCCIVLLRLWCRCHR